MPQAWVPRVLSAAVACVLLACLSPIPTRIADEGWMVRVVVAVVGIPVLLTAAACLMVALRPGSLGRLVRRMRSR